MFPIDNKNAANVAPFFDSIKEEEECSKDHQQSEELKSDPNNDHKRKSNSIFVDSDELSSSGSDGEIHIDLDDFNRRVS